MPACWKIFVWGEGAGRWDSAWDSHCAAPPAGQVGGPLALTDLEVLTVPETVFPGTSHVLGWKSHHHFVYHQDRKKTVANYNHETALTGNESWFQSCFNVLKKNVPDPLLWFLQRSLKAPLQQNQYLQMEDQIPGNKSQSVLHFLSFSLFKLIVYVRCLLKGSQTSIDGESFRWPWLPSSSPYSPLFSIQEQSDPK